MAKLHLSNELNQTQKVLATAYTKIYWNEWLIDPHSSDYNVVLMQDLEGDLDVARLEYALEKTIKDVWLYGCHLEEDSDNLYWVENEIQLPILSHANNLDVEDIQVYCKKPFDLSLGPLCRFKLVDMRCNRYQLLMVFHHVLMDGNTDKILIKNLSENYNHNKKFRTISYEDQKNKLIDLQQKLNKKIPTINHLIDKKIYSEYGDDLNLRSCLYDDEVKEFYFSFKPELVRKIKSFSRENLCTNFHVISALWHSFLCRYMGHDYISIHYPISMIGEVSIDFGSQLNTLIYSKCISNLDDLYKVCGYIKDFNRQLKVGILNLRYIPIFQIIKSLGLVMPDFSIAQSSLKNHILQFNRVTAKINKCYSIDIGSSKFVLLFEEALGGLNACFRYKRAVFSQDTIDHMYRSFVFFMNECLCKPHCPVLHQPLFSDKKNSSILAWGYGKPLDANVKKSFLLQLSKVVKEHAESVALVFKGEHVSYGHLNRYTNQCARFLQDKVKYLHFQDDKSVVIPILMQRSNELVMTIVSILKAGYGYMPIDTDAMPEDQVSQILETLNYRLVITDDATIKDKFTSLEVVDFDYRLFGGYSSSNLDAEYSLKQLIYVLPTSGSTGKPKLIKMYAEGVSLRLHAMKEISKLNNKDTYLFKTNICFDVSFSDIFVPLLSASRLVTAQNHFDIDEINHLINDHNITAMHFVPSQFQSLGKYINHHKLKLINFSGEALKETMLKDVNIKKTKVVNYYGPTETGECIYAIVNDKSDIHIGKPMQGFRVYVLDQWLNNIAPGNKGILYLSGPGVVKRPNIKSHPLYHSFIRNPFCDEQDYCWLYKTNDIASWNEYGSLNYHHRSDAKIKVSGYLIDFNMVENALISVPGVMSAKCYIEPGDNKRYSAYVILIAGNQDIRDIKGQLVRLIPSYMVPHKIIVIDQIPLSKNGKFDSSQLKDLKNNAHSYAPNMPLELKKFHQLFCNILECEYLAIDDNYFLQGATSLNLIELKFHLESLLNIELPFCIFSQYPTILDLYNSILKTDKEVVVPLKNTDHPMQIVCFHAGRGGCEVYRHLVDCLDGTIFGVEPYNYIHYNDKVSGFEKLCEIYARNILLKVGVDRPLFFIGWSFGGLLALKTAELVHKQMPSLRPTVVMLDSLAPSFFNKIIINNTDELWYGPFIDQIESNSLNRHFVEKNKDVAVLHKSMMKESLDFSYNFSVVLFKATQPAGYFCDHVNSMKLFNESMDYSWSKYDLSQLEVVNICATHERIIEKQFSRLVASYINRVELFSLANIGSVKVSNEEVIV